MQESDIYPTASQSMLLQDPSFEFVEISLSASLTEVEWHLQKESILASVRNWREIYFRRCDRATRRKEMKEIVKKYFMVHWHPSLHCCFSASQTWNTRTLEGNGESQVFLARIRIKRSVSLPDSA